MTLISILASRILYPCSNTLFSGINGVEVSSIYFFYDSHLFPSSLLLIYFTTGATFGSWTFM